MNVYELGWQNGGNTPTRTFFYFSANAFKCLSRVLILRFLDGTIVSCRLCKWSLRQSFCFSFSYLAISYGVRHVGVFVVLHQHGKRWSGERSLALGKENNGCNHNFICDCERRGMTYTRRSRNSSDVDNGIVRRRIIIKSTQWTGVDGFLPFWMEKERLERTTL